ncbi:MAG: diphosphomevalonate decarboxylase [Candidatus Hodarchaeota archaeon]
MKKTAIANSNIALVKYWGKRNDELILPYNSSISMTLDKLYTITTVEFSEKYDNFQVIINDKVATDDEYYRIVNHLKLIRQQVNISSFAKVISSSNFPKKAGLASSASGFAALTLAGSEALGLTLNNKELSILARRGSGSAARSILGGFVKWMKGSASDGSDSFAVPLVGKNHWPEISMIVTVVSSKEKKISSRAGMKQTVKTSPLYKAWLDTIADDLKTVEQAIRDKDFTELGPTIEKNALKMHATMHTTTPPILYWQAESLNLMKEVIALREEDNIECYFTMDAGPQVKILCLKKDIPLIKKRISEIQELQDIFICHPGEGTKLIEEHLF